MSTIRAFIAIDLSDEAKAVLADVSGALASQTPQGVVKWVEPHRMHLTLRFLGNTPVDRLDELADALDEAAQAHAPFTLRLDALGCFPNERRPRVIWVGVVGDVARAEALRAAIEEKLEPLGWQPEEKSFRPHLTLGRVKDRKATIDLPWGQGVAPASINVEEIVLFESQLRRSGPQYIARHVSRLGNGDLR